MITARLFMVDQKDAAPESNKYIILQTGAAFIILFLALASMVLA